MSRPQQSFEIRVAAARLARSRTPAPPTPLIDETALKLGSYTKGLPHEPDTGLLQNPDHFDLFVRAIDTGDLEDIKAIPLGPRPKKNRFISGIARGNDDVPVADVRAWESMAAGNAFDLQGPDPQTLALPPAPALDSNELVAEMTELYWMALLRDVPFRRFDTNDDVPVAIKHMNDTTWIGYSADGNQPPDCISEAERARFRGPFTHSTIFRGALTGDHVGPYISQFLLCGTPGIGGEGNVEDGMVSYGANRIDQRVRHCVPNRDYMTTWASWLDVQNGADLRGRERYRRGYRFIATPRDLTTFVHFDALYQAYFNACVILLAIKAPFDEGIPFTRDDDRDKQQGFALFGGPHILTLVTEVSTRALKAIRFQKFNTHRRPRPEAMGGLIERFHHEQDNELYSPVGHLYNTIDSELLDRVARENRKQNNDLKDFGNAREEDFDPRGRTRGTRLLPMAYPEGSPMHPSYGAGHAAVAGACTTILKAWFDTRWKLPFVFEASADGDELEGVDGVELTLEGELNKLCSNISIGRNWGGVHYYTDYIESIKLGEQVAIGMLEEQMLTYREKFSMTIRKFDGTVVKIENFDDK